MVKIRRPDGTLVKLRYANRQPKRQEQIDRFKAEFAANPCNRLPGGVLHNLYRDTRDQKQLERLAAQWIEHHAERRARFFA